MNSSSSTSDVDVVIVGGSYAGMSAAMQLARARRSVVIFDAGQRRNRFAPASHGMLTQDGTSPDEIARVGREQLMAYPTVTWHETRVSEVSGSEGHFTVRDQNDQKITARVLILATGVVDHLPEIDGLRERWGSVAFTCPYCHGYELNQGKIAVIATGPMSVHHAWMLPEWGDVTFFLNGSVELDDEQTELLRSRNVTIETASIRRISGHATIELEDGRESEFAGIAVASTVSVDPLIEKLGCELADGPQGPFVQVDEWKTTTVPGVFACGDIARPVYNLTFAIADGVMAGTASHRSLLMAG